MAAAKNLKGTRFGIAEDLPREWAVIRKRVYLSHIKPAKQHGQQVRWRGAKLFIEGVEVDLTAKQQRQHRASRPRDHHRRSDSDTDRPPPTTSTSPTKDSEDDSDSERQIERRTSSEATLTQSSVDLREQSPEQTEQSTSRTRPRTRAQQKLQRFTHKPRY